MQYASRPRKHNAVEFGKKEPPRTQALSRFFGGMSRHPPDRIRFCYGRHPGGIGTCLRRLRRAKAGGRVVVTDLRPSTFGQTKFKQTDHHVVEVFGELATSRR